MNDEEEKRDLRAVPADQRALGPNETIILSSADLAEKMSGGAAGRATSIEGIPRLVGRSEPVAHRHYELTKPKTMVGRQANNDIVIEDPTVSARHAQIVNDDGIWRVVNLISTNGTAVNGRTGVVSYLAPGDVIAFGQVEMVFEAGDSERTQQGLMGRERTTGDDRASRRIGLWALIIGAVVALVIAASLLDLV